MDCIFVFPAWMLVLLPCHWAGIAMRFPPSLFACVFVVSVYECEDALLVMEKLLGESKQTTSHVLFNHI